MSKPWGKVFVVALAGLLTVAPPTHVPASELAALVMPRAPSNSLFGTKEIHFTNMAQFSRWTNLVARWEGQREDDAELCVSAVTDAAPCAPREWTDLVTRLNGMPLRQQVEEANAAINAHPYIAAQDNWNDPTYWETPFEFMRRNGQCQDYAIAKFFLLRQLGVANDSMRLVVLRDINRQVDHAVLVVHIDGEDMMLDNLAPRVEPIATATNYRAYYSINETGWWLHLPNPMMPEGLVRQVASR